MVIAGCDTAAAVPSSPVTIAIQTSTPEFFYFANNPTAKILWPPRIP